jgi:hypothetical protein
MFLFFLQNSVEDLPESESPSDKKRRLTNDTEGERSSSSIDILDLKSKLEKMGTNVSLAPGGSGASSQMRSPRMSALVDPAAAASPPCASPTTAAAGISVIRNGESFNLANIAEVKLNFDESLRTLSPGRLATHNKPSCAVRPMMKPVTVKPLATVRPLIMQNESQLSAAADADKGAEQLGLPAVNGLTRIPPEELPGHASSSSSSTAAAVRSQNAAAGSPLPFKPLAAVPVSGGEGASASLPLVAHVAAVQKSAESADVSRGGSPLSLPDASSTSAGSSAAVSAAGGRAAAAESSAGESSVSPVIKTEAGDGIVSPQHQNGNHHALSPGLGGGAAASGLVPADTEDVFNADIVCPHGNLRIGDRCKQLISREAWFRLRNYFDSPKTFQFGIDIASFLCFPSV